MVLTPEQSDGKEYIYSLKENGTFDRKFASNGFDHILFDSSGKLAIVATGRLVTENYSVWSIAEMVGKTTGVLVCCAMTVETIWVCSGSAGRGGALARL